MSGRRSLSTRMKNSQDREKELEKASTATFDGSCVYGIAVNKTFPYCSFSVRRGEEGTSIPQDCFSGSGRRPVIFVQNEAGGDCNRRAAPLRAPYDNTDRRRARLWVDRGDPQIPERLSNEARRRAGLPPCESRWNCPMASRWRRESEPGFEIAFGHARARALPRSLAGLERPCAKNGGLAMT